LIGRVLSERYRLDELVAMGAMGAVYRGMHLKMRKEVAIKVLHPDTERFPDLVARFEREAVAGAHINHPNVASASDMGTFDGGSYFLVFEYVHGRTLRDLIDREAPLRPGRVIHIARQLAAALGAAHERGIVHRDLKPGNVMVTELPDAQVKLIDFGLARVPVDRVAPIPDETDAQTLSTPGVVFGTVDYMAPEIVLGMEAIDERSDLYSLGVILYEMLAGKHPFDHGKPHEMLAHHRETVPPPIRERNPRANVPPALEAVVMRLLAKSSGDRYETAAELIEALGVGSAAAEQASSPRAFETMAPPTGQVPRNVATFVVGGVVLLGLVVILAALARSPREERRPADSPPVPPAEASAAPSTPTVRSEAEFAASLRADLVKAAEGDDIAESAAILVALADADKSALKDAAAREAAKKVAVTAAEQGGDPATQVYYAIAYRFGSEGLDLLYDISQGQSLKAARRAGAIVETQARSNRASPALRVAMELRKTACKQKPLLFARASAEGDARALAVLESLQPPACEPDGPACCFRRHVGLERAIETLRARVASP
jgi:serine/threonine-protein kinase